MPLLHPEKCFLLKEIHVIWSICQADQDWAFHFHMKKKTKQLLHRIGLVDKSGWKCALRFYWMSNQKKKKRILDNFILLKCFNKCKCERKLWGIIEIHVPGYFTKSKIPIQKHGFCPKAISLDNQGKALPLLTQLCNALSVCRLTNALKRTLNLFWFPWLSRKVQRLFD